MEPYLSREVETVKRTQRRTRNVTKVADVSTSRSKKQASSSLPESQAKGSEPTKKQAHKTTKSTASLLYMSISLLVHFLQLLRENLIGSLSSSFVLWQKTLNKRL